MSVEHEINSIVSDSCCYCYCCRCYFSSSTATTMNMMTMTNKKPTSRQKFSSSKRKYNTMNIINRTHSTTNSSYSTKWPQLILMGLCFLFSLELCSCIITTISSSSSNLDSSLDRSSGSRSSESSKLVDTDIDVSLPSYDTNTDHRHRNDNSHHRNHIHDHRQHHPHRHHHQHQHQLINSTNERLASAQNYLGRIRADQKRKQVQMQKQKQKRFINFELNEKPQVPEQLPIVVSTSDNSYVSASPIIINPQQQKATTLAPETTTLVVNNNNEPDHHQMNNHQHHRPNLRTTNTISSQHHNSFESPFHSRQPLSNHIRLDHHQRDEENRKHRFWSSWHRNPLFWSSKEALQADNSIRGSSIYLDDNNNKISSSSSSTSDISTTATTTQRNSQDIGLLGEVMKPATSTSTKPESLISRFEIKLATIINTQESIDAGATFINYTVVTNFDACLVECWITDSCDTAIYQESTTASMSSSSSSSKPSSSQSPYSYSERQHNYLHSKRRQHSNNINNNNNLISFDGSTFDSSNSIYHICFLFECIKSDGFRCQFSAHDNYVSSILMKKINSVTGDEENSHQTMHHSKRKSNGNDEEEAENYYTRISDKKRENSARKNAIIQVEDNDDDGDEDEGEGEDAENEDKEKENNFVSGRICNSVLEFRCSSLQCIELDQRCDGIVDCIDGSDESDCPNFITIDDADSNIIQTRDSQQGKKVFRSIPSVSGKGDHVSSSKDDAETSSILAMAKTARKHDFLNEYRLIDDQDQIGNSFNLKPIIEPKSEVHYSRIIDHHHHNGHTLNRLDPRGSGSWHHDTHIASIRIGEYEDYERGGLNSALIAIVFGIAITGMLIMIVGHKMRSIRKRLAYKNRRRSLVPDKELFINTLPI